MSRPTPSVELIAAARAGDAKALRELIDASMWVVNAQIKRRRHMAVFSGSLDDLKQAAIVGDAGKAGGLLGAIKTFDPEGGANFWTHATIWIRGAIYRESNTRCDGNLVNRRRLRRRKLRMKARLTEELGRQPTEEELHCAVPVLGLVGHAKVSIEECTDLGMNTSGTKLGARGSSGGGRMAHYVAEVLSDRESENRLSRGIDARRAAALLVELPERERTAFERHVFDDRTFTEIGEELGISREWARQAYLIACQRLRAMLTHEAAA